MNNPDPAEQAPETVSCTMPPSVQTSSPTAPRPAVPSASNPTGNCHAASKPAVRPKSTLKQVPSAFSRSSAQGEPPFTPESRGNQPCQRGHRGQADLSKSMRSCNSGFSTRGGKSTVPEEMTITISTATKTDKAHVDPFTILDRKPFQTPPTSTLRSRALSLSRTWLRIRSLVSLQLVKQS